MSEQFQTEKPTGLSIFSDMPSLSPFEMMTGKGWMDEGNFYLDKEDQRWKVRLKSIASQS